MLVGMKAPQNQPRPDDTRGRLIHAAFSEIYRNGFQPTGLDAVLAKAELTKGAIYYHFKNKAELGHAVFDEVVVPWIKERWIEPVRDAEDPLGEIIKRVRALTRAPLRGLSLGCPLNNLVQESSGVDPKFRGKMQTLLDEWRDQFAKHLRRGQKAGFVDQDLRVTDAAAFIVASLEGVMGVVKPAPDLKAFRRAVSGFVSYLESLRPAYDPGSNNVEYA